MQNNYDKRQEDIYRKVNLKFADATIDLQNAKELASDSTMELDKVVESNTVYFVNLSDLHIPEGNMFLLAETLKKFARIPNIYFGFGGDQINNSIKSSVGDTHSEPINPQAQVKLLAEILKEADKQVPILDKIVFIESGNHENRTDNEASVNPAYLLAAELGLQSKYAKNIVKINFINEKRENPLQKIKTVLITTHGEQKPSKSGAQSEAALKSDIDQGADIVVYGHNHKIAKASSYKQFYVPNRATPIQKEITYVNFGSYIAGGEYADRAGYPYPRTSDMEILRITNVNGEKKFDLVNYRSLVNSLATSKINEVDRVFTKLEKQDFLSEAEIKKEYFSAVKKICKPAIEKYKKEKATRDAYVSSSGISDKIYFVPLSGLRIGDENYKSNDKDIKEKVEILTKLNGSCKIILNGDIVFYKKAFTITNKNGSMLGEKFPEETFSYLLKAAELLKPVAKRIIAYNTGFEEEKIFKYHSEALAKMAMVRLQMDEKLCYMPYNKVIIESKILKIQAKKVEAHNKQVLDRAVQNAYKDINKTIKECLPYVNPNYEEYDDDNKEKLVTQYYNKFKECSSGYETTKSGRLKYNEEKDAGLKFLQVKLLVPKLRKEHKLLDMNNKNDFSRINHKFPLDDTELRTPHVNLIQNIFCHLVDINPKDISINITPNTSNYTIATLRDDMGKVRKLGFVGGASKSMAGRGAVEGHLKNKNVLMPGASIYYTNTRLGKEFVMLDSNEMSDPVNGKTRYDTVYISGGTFATGFEDEIAANRIYKLTATANKDTKCPVVSRGIYQNVTKPFNLYCESLNYETILLEDDLVLDMVKKQLTTSFHKKFEEFKDKQKQHQVDNALTKLEDLFDKVEVPKKAIQNITTIENPEFGESAIYERES